MWSHPSFTSIQTRKSRAKKSARKGTTQLQTKKPKTGGLRGITTGSGTNTASGGGGTGGSYS